MWLKIRGVMIRVLGGSGSCCCGVASAVAKGGVMTWTRSLLASEKTGGRCSRGG